MLRQSLWFIVWLAVSLSACTPSAQLNQPATERLSYTSKSGAVSLSYEGSWRLSERTEGDIVLVIETRGQVETARIQAYIGGDSIYFSTLGLSNPAARTDAQAALQEHSKNWQEVSFSQETLGEYAVFHVMGKLKSGRDVSAYAFKVGERLLLLSAEDAPDEGVSFTNVEEALRELIRGMVIAA